jgi:transcriptional regulator with XRE-family HTH domain
MRRKSSTQSATWAKQKMRNVGCSTWEDLATLTGLDRGTVYRYFHQEQEPRAGVLPTLARSLDVSIDELLDGLGLLP